MKVKTTKCGSFGHPEFILQADEPKVADVSLNNIVKTIESMVANGSVFHPGQTFQIGWMITRIESVGTSQLTLHEPDMQSMPIRWIPGITETLRQMVVQLFTLDSFSLRHEMAIPGVRQSVLVCTEFKNPEFFMERFAPANENKADTGWFIGCMHKHHDHNAPANVRCISVYEAFLNQRDIQDFVSFPLGTKVEIDREGLRVTRDGKPLAPVKGGFLDPRLKNNGGL